MFEADKIAFVSQVSDVVMYVSLTAGLLILVIGYFAGARENINKIIACALIVTTVGVLALRIPIAIHDFIGGKKTAPVQSSEQVTDKAPVTNSDKAEPKSSGLSGEGMLNFFLYVGWTGFLVCMGIFLYEAMTVTAREARPD